MATRKVGVSSKQDMDTAVSSYIAQGYVIMHKTDTSVILTKKKEFSIPIAIIGFLFAFIGLALYAIIYACMKDKVVEISIT